MKNWFSYITQGAYGITSGSDSVWLVSLWNFIRHFNTLELPWCPVLNVLDEISFMGFFSRNCSIPNASLITPKEISLSKRITSIDFFPPQHQVWCLNFGMLYRKVTVSFRRPVVLYLNGFVGQTSNDRAVDIAVNGMLSPAFVTSPWNQSGYELLSEQSTTCLRAMPRNFYRFPWEYEVLVEESFIAPCCACGPLIFWVMYELRGWKQLLLIQDLIQKSV